MGVPTSVLCHGDGAPCTASYVALYVVAPAGFGKAFASAPAVHPFQPRKRYAWPPMTWSGAPLKMCCTPATSWIGPAVCQAPSATYAAPDNGTDCPFWHTFVLTIIEAPLGLMSCVTTVGTPAEFITVSVIR